MDAVINLAEPYAPRSVRCLLSSKNEPGELPATGPDDLTACAWDLA